MSLTMMRIILIAAALSLTALAQAQEFKPFGIGLEEPLAGAEASAKGWTFISAVPTPNTHLQHYGAYIADDGLVCEVDGTRIGSSREIIQHFLELHQELKTIYGPLGIAPYFLSGPYEGKSEEQAFADGELALSASSDMQRANSTFMSLSASSNGERAFLRVVYKSRENCSPAMNVENSPTGSSGL